MDVVFIEEAQLQMKAASRTGKITKYEKSRAVTYVYHVRHRILYVPHLKLH